MDHQIQVKCNHCNTILNFSAQTDIERIVNCIECNKEIKVLVTYTKVYGKKVKKVKVTGGDFVPESQRGKYNY